jgi:nucleotide-binding universal stress UspA family protein
MTNNNKYLHEKVSIMEIIHPVNQGFVPKRTILVPLDTNNHGKILAFVHSMVNTTDLIVFYHSYKENSQINDLMKQYCRDFNTMDVHCKAIIQKGDPVKSIIEQLDNEKVNLIVMGKRNLGIKKYFVDSVSNDILQQVEIPVVIVPQ